MRLELQTMSLTSMSIINTIAPLHTNAHSLESKHARLHLTSKDVPLQTGMQARVGKEEIRNINELKNK